MTTVYIVDDDDSVRSALTRLIRSADMQVDSFAGVEAFLNSDTIDEKGCVIADISMPGIEGLALPELLQQRGVSIPVIFVTAYDSHEARSEARRVKAAGYFRKPVDDQALLDAIAWALSGQDQSSKTAEL